MTARIGVPKHGRKKKDIKNRTAKAEQPGNEIQDRKKKSGRQKDRTAGQDSQNRTSRTKALGLQRLDN